ncbi:MAG: hypothetical protein JSS09_04705 [Verrucomicrobia bacterium]|nr:hypothetical protein [Verrucomicrobiota bacterium]
MSKEALAGCQERGTCLTLRAFSRFLSSKDHLSDSLKTAWEERYGKGFWIRREAWFKKPFSLLLCPFSSGLWIDVDCQVKGSLEGIFHCMNFDVTLGVAKDRDLQSNFLTPKEIQYNSGVIAFKKDAPILKEWIETSLAMEHLLPGDQETLSRAISSFQPKMIELPSIYNWYRSYGPNENAIIHHFCGGPGKIEILNNFSPKDSTESLLLLQSLKSIKHH